MGEKDDIRAAIKIFKDYYSTVMANEYEFEYNAFKTMDSTVKDNLIACLKIECGVILSVINKGNGQTTICLKGVMINKAFNIIFSHPVINFDRK